MTVTAAGLVEVVLATMTAFGAVLVWRARPYRSFAVFLCFLCLVMVLNLLEQQTQAFLITPVFTLAKGPLLYLFVRDIVGERRPGRYAWWAHFIPVLFPLPFGLGAALTILLGTASQLVYIGLAINLLVRYRKAVDRFRSDALDLSLTWLTVVISGFALQACLGLLRLNLQPLLSREWAEAWFVFDLLFLLFLCSFAVLRVARQPGLFDQLAVSEKVEAQVTANNRPADEAGAREFFVSLNALVLKDRLFLRPRLSLADLSQITGLQMKDISWAINQGGSRNFNDYINGLRVEEFKQRVRTKGDDDTLLGLALDCGFNAKSSFNTAFRRETGLTPSQYLRQCREGKPAPA